MTSPARRSAPIADDGISYTKPEQAPWQWENDVGRPHCRQGHPLGHILNLPEEERTLRGRKYYGEVRILIRCKRCKGLPGQLGIWHIREGRIRWHGIPDESTFDELAELPSMVPTAALLEILRQRLGAME